jgi:hypothetical protein
VSQPSIADFNKLFRRVRLQYNLDIDYHEARGRFDQLIAAGEVMDDAAIIDRVLTDKVPRKVPYVPFREVGSYCQQRQDSLEASRQRHIMAAKIGFRPKPDRCEVCHRRSRVVLDHCHDTEKLRGWLCDDCNRILGMVADDAERLDALAAYLRTNT